MVNLAAIDLNLLVTLDALLDERHVTRAAKRVGLTQPAMSNALARLRKLLDDPLLVRTPDGMRPTPRAERLQAPLAAALRQLERQVLAESGFDPLTAQQTFRISCHDYEQLVLVPTLLARLAREAPHVRLEFIAPSDRDAAADLREGRADLVVGVREITSPGLVRATLFTDGFQCMLRQAHPLAKGKLTLERFAALEHVLVSPFGGLRGNVDEALAAHGLTRVVKAAVSQFSVAPWAVLHTDCIVTLPARTAALFATVLPVVVREPPLPLKSFPVELCWHERTQADLAHQWLRQVIKSVATGRS